MISFLSDFGLDDEFVGVVHGVIGRIAPDIRVIDLTHNIGAGDVRGERWHSCVRSNTSPKASRSLWSIPAWEPIVGQ